MAASSGSEEDDPHQQAKAYNASIYLMLGMPYLILGGFGLAFYRSVKQASLNRDEKKLD